MEMATADRDPLIITTGRGRGDEGQPTCRDSTRTEHVLMSETLYAMNLHTKCLSAVTMADHIPLRWSLHGSPT